MAHKIAIVIYSNIATEPLSRTYRALGFAQELIAAGDDVAIVFDGGGSETLALMLDPSHDLHDSWTAVASALRGACRYCAKSYGVMDKLKAAGVPLLAEDKGHASLRGLLEEGRQIVTF